MKYNLHNPLNQRRRDDTTWAAKKQIQELFSLEVGPDALDQITPAEHTTDRDSIKMKEFIRRFN